MCGAGVGGGVVYLLAVFAGVSVVRVDPRPWRRREQHFLRAVVSTGAESQLTSGRGDRARNSGGDWSRSAQRSGGLRSTHTLDLLMLYN